MSIFSVGCGYRGTDLLFGGFCMVLCFVVSLRGLCFTYDVVCVLLICLLHG